MMLDDKHLTFSQRTEENIGRPLTRAHKADDGIAQETHLHGVVLPHRHRTALSRPFELGDQSLYHTLCWYKHATMERRRSLLPQGQNQTALKVLWRNVKYEDVYLRAYETLTELRTGLARYFGFYNPRRRHNALDRRTPDAVCFD